MRSESFGARVFLYGSAAGRWGSPTRRFGVTSTAIIAAARIAGHEADHYDGLTQGHPGGLAVALSGLPEGCEDYGKCVFRATAHLQVGALLNAGACRDEVVFVGHIDAIQMKLHIRKPVGIARVH